MKCPNCGKEDPPPPTTSDNLTTTCPRCGHRFPISEPPGGITPVITRRKPRPRPRQPVSTG